jgi:hypothetical protein
MTTDSEEWAYAGRKFLAQKAMQKLDNPHGTSNWAGDAVRNLARKVCSCSFGHEENQ